MNENYIMKIDSAKYLVELLDLSDKVIDDVALPIRDKSSLLKAIDDKISKIFKVSDK